MNLLNLEGKLIKKCLKSSKIYVTIYGLGHVGLPLACAWLRAGAKIIGVDKNKKIVNKINCGVNPIRDEPALDPIVRKYVSSGFFRATNDGVYAASKADVLVVAVPTGIRWDVHDKPLDLSILREVVETIARGIRKGSVVIIEPTVPPGTTVNLVKPLLEEISDLRVENDIGLAYSPERIMTGHALQDIEENYPKIVGGIGPKSTRVVKVLYEEISRKGVIVVSSPTIAEFGKIAEGIYRDVNIAIANELGRLASRLGIDFGEVRMIANSQPYCHLHKPGTGVGGYCIPIYPYFLIHTAGKLFMDLPLVRLARVINESMPRYVVNLSLKAVKELGLSIDEVKVAILGLAFRGGIADTRLSPTYDLIKHFNGYGIRNIVIHDPYVNKSEDLNVKIYRNLEEAVENRDLIVVSTDHPEYKNLTPLQLKKISGKDKIAIIDGRDIIDIGNLPRKGIIYVGVGRPWIKE